MISISENSNHEPAMERSFPRRMCISLFLLGLLLRASGLLFNGMHDLDQILLEWGAAVNAIGLGHGYQGIYGVFTYAILGPAVWLSEFLPRFWWLPYKLIEILFEIAILWTLYQILPPSRKHLPLFLYWLNPWFVVHGAWLGFWDGPHTLCGLLAVLAIVKLRRENLAWFLVGAAIMSSAFFKPQGAVFFLMPVVIYLSLRFLLHNHRGLAWFAIAAVLVALVAFLAILVTGGGVWVIPASYARLARIMPNLSNGSINIWRTVTSLLQTALGQSGPSYTLVLPPMVLASINMLAGAVTMFIVLALCCKAVFLEKRPIDDRLYGRVVLFSRLGGLALLLVFLGGLCHTSNAKTHDWLLFGRYSWKFAKVLGVILAAGSLAIAFARPLAILLRRFALKTKDLLYSDAVAIRASQKLNAFGILFVLALPALVIPQLNTRMHINHAYAGLVLLIPFACAGRKIMTIWLILIAIHFYCHLLGYGLGRPSLFPSGDWEYVHAQALLEKIQTAAAAHPYHHLLAFHATGVEVIRRCLLLNNLLPANATVSVLSAVQFVCVIALLFRTFASRLPGPDDGVLHTQSANRDRSA